MTGIVATFYIEGNEYAGELARIRLAALPREGDRFTLETSKVTSRAPCGVAASHASDHMSGVVRRIVHHFRNTRYDSDHQADMFVELDR